MEETLFQVPGNLDDVRLTRHRSAIIRCSTQEDLPDALISRLASLTGKEGWFTFSVEQIKPGDLVDLPVAPKVEGKSLSQRLRQLLWRVAEFEGVPEEKRDAFYEKEMIGLIETYKYRLEPPIDTDPYNRSEV